MPRKHNVPRLPVSLVVSRHFKEAIWLNMRPQYGLYEGITAIAIPLYELCAQHPDACDAMWDGFIESLERTSLPTDDDFDIWDVRHAAIIKAILDGHEDPLPEVARDFGVDRSTPHRWCIPAMEACLENLLLCLVLTLEECGLDARVARLRELFPFLL